LEWDVFPAAGFGVTGQEAPGFAVAFEVGAGGVAGVGIEADAFAVSDGFDGDDVPDIFGDDVGDEEVDFGGGVDGVAGSGGADAVSGLGVAAGGFDLDAEEAGAAADDGVVAFTVSPGDADAEAEAGGAGQEGGFGGFAAALAGGSGDGVEGDYFGDLEWARFPAGALELGRLELRQRQLNQDVRWVVRVCFHNEKGAAGGLRLMCSLN